MNFGTGLSFGSVTDNAFLHSSVLARFKFGTNFSIIFDANDSKSCYSHSYIVSDNIHRNWFSVWTDQGELASKDDSYCKKHFEIICKCLDFGVFMESLKKKGKKSYKTGK